MSLLSLAACPRPEDEKPAIEGGRAIEVRGADGHVRLGIVANATRARWTAQKGDGEVVIQAGKIESAPGAGAALQLRKEDHGGLVITLADTVRLRLARVDDRLRVGDGAGVPLGRIRLEGNAAVLHDAAGMLAAQAVAEGGRIVVSDRDEHVLGYVVGLQNLEQAVALFAKEMKDEERALIVLAGALWPTPGPAPQPAR